MNRLKTILGAMIFLLVSVQVDASSIIFPNGAHDRWDVIPFGERSGDGLYQQIFSGLNFSNPVVIKTTAFSLLRTATFVADIELRFGYTQIDPSSIESGPFENLKSDTTDSLTTVFDDDSFSQSVTGGSEAFGLIFDHDDYIYDPTLGNLLLEILISRKSDEINEQGVSMIASIPSSETARSYSMTGFQGVNPWGMRTQFSVSPVPVPAAFWLFGTVLIGLVGFGRRKKADVSVPRFQ